MTMSASDLYRSQVCQFESELHEALSSVEPLVAESAVGRVTLANVLIKAAIRLLAEDSGPAFTQKVVGHLVHMHIGSNSGDA